MVTERQRLTTRRFLDFGLLFDRSWFKVSSKQEKLDKGGKSFEAWTIVYRLIGFVLYQCGGRKFAKFDNVLAESPSSFFRCPESSI